MLRPIFVFLFCCVVYCRLHSQNACSCTEYALLSIKNTDENIIFNKLIKSSTPICVAKEYELLGLSLIKTGNADSAEIILQKAEEAYKKTGCGDSVFYSVYKYQAQILQSKGEFGKAQEKLFSTLKAAETTKNSYEIAVTLLSIAQMFNQTSQANKGIIYTRKAILLSKQINEPLKRADIYFKISKRLLWHYQDTKAMTSLDSSELYSKQQLDIAKSTNQKNLISTAYSNLQGVAWERKEFKKAIAFLDSAFKYCDTSNYNVLGSLYSDKADNLIQLKQFERAKLSADSSIYFRDKTGNIAYRVYGYQLLGSIAKENGDFRTAYDYYVKERLLSDSLGNLDKVKQVSEIEKKYNQAKNESTIKDLDKKRQFYLFLAIAGLFAALAVGFFLRQQSLKHKKDILETEQRLNRARMNPHFFFNALSTLQKLALRENSGQAMASNLSRFSNIMRETLESTYKDYVTIEHEIEFLSQYLEVQRIRFPETFSYEVIAADDLDIDELQIPSMIIQPFVENSIEHGFAGVNYPGKVSISFKKNIKELLVQIIDNGKGLSPKGKENNEHVSRASQIIKDRIYLLNIKLKTKARFSIDNNPGDKGVIVSIYLPLLFKEQGLN